MAERKLINDNITVGPQPTANEIENLPGEGFKSVVNVRTTGEDEQPLTPDAEGDAVKSAGLEYLHVPVSMNSIDPSVVDQFRNYFDDLSKPAFVHCKSGKRAGALVMMHLSCEEGLSGQQTLDKADALGFECDPPELKEFVVNYVDTHCQ